MSPPEVVDDHVILGMATSSPAEDRFVALMKLREANEQLLLAGLREHSLATEFKRQLAVSSAITESLAEGVCALDGAGQITFANAAAERMLGWQEAELRGRDVSALLPRQGAASSSDRLPLLDVFRSGMTSRNDRAIFIRKDGTTFPVAYSVAPIIAEAQVMGAVLAFDDQTKVQHLHQMQEEYLTLRPILCARLWGSRSPLPLRSGWRCGDGRRWRGGIADADVDFTRPSHAISRGAW